MPKPHTRALTSFKKQDGVLVLSEDNKILVWTPAAPPKAPPALTMLVQNITNLQQTPATSAKVSIRVLLTRPGAPAPDSYVFVFTSADTARDEQVAITAELTHAVDLAKKQSTEAIIRATTLLEPARDGGSGSAAMAFAKAVSGSSRADRDAMLDDAQLIGDLVLQQSLLKSDAVLKQRFNESLKEKPESITSSQFSTQFWSTRAHLLRAHAVEKGQKHGAHNVLSEVKRKNDKLEISKEQIQTMFEQHPIIRRVYNETVPSRLREEQFWGDFLQSRLLKTIKGERIDPSTDALNPILDKYINFDEEADQAKQTESLHVPHFIDLEGNEQNHSQRQGNRPDWTMRPNGHDRVPILRALNNMSEKMMKEVRPSDAEAHAPVGLDENTFNQLQLRDLQRRSDDNRIMLNVKDQSHFLAGDRVATNGVSAEAALFSKQSPAKVLAKLQDDLKTSFVTVDGAFGANLETALGIHDDSSSGADSETETRAAKRLRVGSKAARTAAAAHVMQLVRTRRAQMSTADLTSDAPSGTFGPLAASAVALETGLSKDVISSLIMTHSTAIEFLHYFYSVFYSGDPDRAGELKTLSETLDNSIKRIEAVAESAEEERRRELARQKAQADEYVKKTGRSRRRMPSPKGGRAEVLRVAEPTLAAVRLGARRYAIELERQQRIRSSALPGAADVM